MVDNIYLSVSWASSLVVVASRWHACQNLNSLSLCPTSNARHAVYVTATTQQIGTQQRNRLFRDGPSCSHPLSSAESTHPATPRRFPPRPSRHLPAMLEL